MMNARALILVHRYVFGCWSRRSTETTKSTKTSSGKKGKTRRTRPPEMESKCDDVENVVIRLVIVPSDADADDRDGSSSATSVPSTSVPPTSIPPTSGRPRPRRIRGVCEFYAADANVTPREIASVRHPMNPCAVTSCRNRIMSITHTYSWSRENYDDYFLRIDAVSHDELLDGVLSDGRRRYGDEEPYETKYDVGPDVAFPGANAIADGDEIELTESPTFHVVDVPNTVAAEGDGDYERIRRTDDVYRDNRTRARATTDAAAQTVNASADRRDDGCQTCALPAGTGAGTQTDGLDAAGGRDARRRVSAVEDVERTGDVARTAMFVARTAAQNALLMTAAGRRRDETPSAPVRLDYRFTLTRHDGGPAVGCTHWNGAQTHLLAVAYSDAAMRDDREHVPNAAVAVWSTKNPYAPERFYQFNESAAITCIRFSVEYPSRLAVGFDSGEILIVNIRNERLETVFRKSKHSPPDIHGILGLSWTVRLENDLSSVDQFECLVTCNSHGGIERYRVWTETFERRTICENGRLAENDERPAADAGQRPEPVCRATRFRRLGQDAYLVGTAEGAVYTCTYDNLRCYSTKTYAHLGVVKSLERSPHSPDVYLTTGCDCTVKVWMSDLFVDPVITLAADGQIEKAVWSPSNPTVVASVVDNRLLVWDMDTTTDVPVAVLEMRTSGRSARCVDAEFAADGSHLSVCDTDGNVVVYAWSDAAPPSDRQADGRRDLMRCVAMSLRGKPYLVETLCRQQPEYADVFAAIEDER